MPNFPTDVFVLDRQGLLAARLERNGKGPRIAAARHHRFQIDPFVEAAVTPSLEDASALSEAVRRAQREAGRLDRASLLLPDSWFRMNLLDLPTGDRSTSPVELIRWAVKRTLPIRPEEMRFAWVPLAKSAAGSHVLALGAVDGTLSRIEASFRDAGVTLVLIEPVGLNVWNALAASTTDAASTRLFFHVGETEFTTALFQGPTPLFVRSRNLGGGRSLQQEIALSASYMKSRLEWNTPSESWVAGQVDDGVGQAIESEFGAPVRRLRLGDVTSSAPDEAGRWEAELLGCVGVFTA
ncbi:MAG: hypothetical protein ACRD2J_16780 [Thermoanaerobaculia bacterium]